MRTRKQLHVAIYTRKSSEEGLDQEFNSLDAQREACEAFTASQRELGWKLLADRYDDGGPSGGTLARPTLQQLLEAVRSNRIDVIVVCNIDRLTRSLMDFSKMVEALDEYRVSFVSVTQQFNTVTSMGRLTLNTLLSFAQFEREVTAERIRDKVATSKKSDICMGDVVPLSYDAIDRKRVINEAEAEAIRWLYKTYLELGSVIRLNDAADTKGIRSKRRNYASGKNLGGERLWRGQVYWILCNLIYAGKLRHKGTIHEGQHEAIIGETTFDGVQKQLGENAATRQPDRNVSQWHLLTGIIFDETGNRLSRSHSSKQCKRYHCYVSHRLLQARRKDKDSWHLPAQHVETIVLGHVAEFLKDKPKLFDLLNPGKPSAQDISNFEQAAH